MASAESSAPASATKATEEPKQAVKPTEETKKPADPPKETKPADPPKETKPADPPKETKPADPPKETKPADPPKETKPADPPKETKPADTPKPEPRKEASPKPAEVAKEEEEKTSDNKKDEKKEDAKSPEPEANGETPGTPKGPTLREQFRAFSKFGDIKSDGKVLTLSQSDKWMKQAKVIEAKTITTTDTAITFRKFKLMKIGYPDYEKYLTDLAKSKNQDLKSIKDKMKNCGTPGTRGTTSVAKGGAFDRLTDTKTYTGSHKQRFDAEGKGKGVSGRKDLDDKSGYVSGYKNKNTYSKTH